jgi:nucleoside-diphosphate-sugar epimerase
VPRRLAAVGKARDLLGFTPRVALRDGLGELVAWWRARQSGDGD